ncbi:hypothetical protein OG242_25585 [Streptomyces sp. NBC_00727]|uniref:hypothetical protein n=1 Tax=Streptomyces sp. NBC_00727 TaxID=2903675 RepID=UPI0038685E2E
MAREPSAPGVTGLCDDARKTDRPGCREGRERSLDKGGSSIPDEEWERFLREAGTPGAPEEPALKSYRVDSANGGCDNTTGYFRPEFEKERGTSDDGTKVDPYERGTSMDERMRDRDAAECGTATRT